MKIRQECGQKWYRLSSWYRRYPSDIHWPKFRRLFWEDEYLGFAFGPLMFFKKGKS